MKLKYLYQNYLLPAAVFQSVIIGGGYATGREIIEYITVNGPIGGLLSAFVIACGFAIVLGISFTFAKTFAISNYRDFLLKLLGPAWVFYEILFLLLLVLVIAIVTAAACETAEIALGTPRLLTVSAICVLIISFNYLGKPFIEKALATWTFLLMSTLCAYTICALTQLDTLQISSQQLKVDVYASTLSGFKFAVYNSALVPVLIYCTTQIEDKQSALKAGIFTGIVGVIPAVLLHLCFLTRYPEITKQAVPTHWLLHDLGFADFESLYLSILFGTIVLTAVGILHGVNERINGWLRQHNREQLKPRNQALIAGAIVISSIILSKIGIITLVAKGYGTLSWAFFCVFTIPLLTIGINKVITKESNNET